MEDKRVCKDCGLEVKYYDTILRGVRTKGGKKHFIRVSRYKCRSCGSIHRAIPNHIYPYKQYEKEIINGVVEGLITSDTLGYEDYPCQMTMLRWISAFSHRSCFY